MYEYITDSSRDRSNQGLIYFGRAIKYDEFIGGTNELAAALKGFFGIKKGENAAICLPNIPQAVMAVYACNRLGIVCNMIHPLLSPNGLLAIIKNTKPAVLFTADNLYAKNKDVISKCGIKTVVCDMGTYAPFYMTPIIALKFRRERAEIEYGENTFKFSEVLRRGRETGKNGTGSEKRGIEADFLGRGRGDNDGEISYGKGFPAEGNGAECGNKGVFLDRGRGEGRGIEADFLDGVPFPKGSDPAVYLHSGGTSGDPKTIVLSNRALNSHTKSCFEGCGNIEGVMFMAMPLFHGFGLGVCMHSTLSIGQRIALFPKFEARAAAKAIKKHKINFIVGVPLMYEKLLNDEFFQKIDKSNLQKLTVGGDVLNPELKKRFDALLKEGGASVRLSEGYGLTEAVSVVAVDFLMNSKPNSVGQPLPGVKIKITDDNLRELKNGEKGEILVSTDYIMDGYYNDPEATAKTIVTGDKITFLTDEKTDGKAEKSGCLKAENRGGKADGKVENHGCLKAENGGIVPRNNAGGTPCGVSGSECENAEKGGIVPRNNEHINAAKRENEKWVRTDDIGYFDADGDLHFVSRRKRIIIIAGINVYPTEIEGIVSGLPEINLCCAVEGKKPDGKPYIKLFVVLNGDAVLDGALKEKIKKACADNLIAYAVPSEIIQKSELPLTKMAKVDYRKLESLEGN
jgi:acyl-CoA synthetase (AMP-forming)/AMP-acid ligase II